MAMVMMIGIGIGIGTVVDYEHDAPARLARSSIILFSLTGPLLSFVSAPFVKSSASLTRLVPIWMSSAAGVARATRSQRSGREGKSGRGKRKTKKKRDGRKETSSRDR